MPKQRIASEAVSRNCSKILRIILISISYFALNRHPKFTMIFYGKVYFDSTLLTAHEANMLLSVPWDCCHQKVLHLGLPKKARKALQNLY